MMYTTLDQSERAVEVVSGVSGGTSELNGWRIRYKSEALARISADLVSGSTGRNIEDLIELPLMNDPAITQYFRCPDRGRAAGPVYRP